jgi:hypothetical protein
MPQNEEGARAPPFFSQFIERFQTMRFHRFLIPAVSILVLCACQEEATSVAQEDTTVANLAPSSQQEMRERIAAAKQKVGWADPEIGKGVLAPVQAAALQ